MDKDRYVTQVAETLPQIGRLIIVRSQESYFAGSQFH